MTTTKKINRKTYESKTKKKTNNQRQKKSLCFICIITFFLNIHNINLCLSKLYYNRLTGFHRIIKARLSFQFFFVLIIFCLFSFFQAYVKRQANSVKIAKIIAATIILSSFILGGFMLAATYMQSRAMCDQMQTLENALDKEIMLEMLAQVSFSSNLRRNIMQLFKWM